MTPNNIINSCFSFKQQFEALTGGKLTGIKVDGATFTKLYSQGVELAKISPGVAKAIVIAWDGIMNIDGLQIVREDTIELETSI